MYLARDGVARLGSSRATTSICSARASSRSPSAGGSRAVLAAVSAELPRRRRTRARTSTGCSAALGDVSAGRRAAPSQSGATTRPDTRRCSTAHRATWVLIDEPKFKSSSIRQAVGADARRQATADRLHPPPRPQRRGTGGTTTRPRIATTICIRPTSSSRSPRSRADAAHAGTARAHVPQQPLLGQGRRQRGDPEAATRPADCPATTRPEMVDRYPELEGRRRLLRGLSAFDVETFLIMSVTCELVDDRHAAVTCPMMACLPSRPGLAAFMM